MNATVTNSKLSGFGLVPFFKVSAISLNIKNDIVVESIKSKYYVVLYFGRILCSRVSLRSFSSKRSRPFSSTMACSRVDCSSIWRSNVSNTFEWSVIPLEEKIWSSCHYPNTDQIRWNVEALTVVFLVPVILSAHRQQMAFLLDQDYNTCCTV